MTSLFLKARELTRDSPEGRKYTWVSGKCCQYDQPSCVKTMQRDRGVSYYRDLIAPDAFGDYLTLLQLGAQAQPFFAADHRLNGEDPAGEVLKLFNVGNSVYWSGVLADNSAGRRVRDALERDIVRPVSIRWKIAKERWTTDNDGCQIRETVEAAHIIEISVLLESDRGALPDTYCSIDQRPEDFAHTRSSSAMRPRWDRPGVRQVLTRALMEGKIMAGQVIGMPLDYLAARLQREQERSDRLRGPWGERRSVGMNDPGRWRDDLDF